uniref:Alanine--tRNA ligase n=1 Tax=Palpitomonas bilix TaxID=652834 RepID=A0A7S3CZX4_9EUKA
MAWSLLVDVLGLPRDRLYATYFEGDEAAGLEPDNEARERWLKYLPESHVLPGNAKDNFWEMGDTGPCGPCSELHFDRIGGREAASLVNQDDPDVLEVWNLVFIQYNREEKGGSLKLLPSKHVDTGMGLERLVSVLQDKRSNYDTDCFMPIFEKIREVTGVREYTGKVGKEDVDGVDTAYRVVADHARTIAIACADGAQPSNDGRGYVLRRVLRRGVRYARQQLGGKKGFFAQIVKKVIDMMSGFFKELADKEEIILDIVESEEAQFLRTIDRGIKKFEKAISDLAGNGGVVLSGEVMFQLYDTYGFPVDLTTLMAEERNISVDTEGYKKRMLEAKELSKQAGESATGAKTLKMEAEQTEFLAGEGVEPTDDSFKYNWIPSKRSGDDVSATIKAIWTGSEFAKTAGEGQFVGIVVDKTNFYAEQGGQIFDTGSISSPDGDFHVENVQRFGRYVMHIGTVSDGEVRVDEEVTLSVDCDRRADVAKNHTGTHIMNFGLRKVLGDHCDQKGSIVLPDKLRFDFANNSPVKPAEIAEVQSIVQKVVQQKLPVYAETLSLETAREIYGLRAVFGEAYPDPVRVLSVGVPPEKMVENLKNEEWAGYSVEFCGGTHLHNSGEAEEFVIVSEEGIAKGIRRIVALTGEKARDAIELAESLEEHLRNGEREAEKVPMDVGAMSKTIANINKKVDEAVIPLPTKEAFRARIAKMRDIMGKEHKKNVQAAKGKAKEYTEQIVEELSKEDNLKFIVKELPAFFSADPKLVNDVSEKLKSALTVPCVLVSLDEVSDKLLFLATVPDELAKTKGAAKDWMAEALTLCDGKGGGKPNRAQGIGKNPAQMAAAVASLKSFAEKNYC